MYATTFHKGDYETTYLAYKRLIKYIEFNNYVVVGNEYEDALLDTCTKKSEEEYLTRVSIQVEKLKKI